MNSTFDTQYGRTGNERRGQETDKRTADSINQTKVG
jgi:hypothetical protein